MIVLKEMSESLVLGKDSLIDFGKITDLRLVVYTIWIEVDMYHFQNVPFVGVVFEPQYRSPIIIKSVVCFGFMFIERSTSCLRIFVGLHSLLQIL